MRRLALGLVASFFAVSPLACDVENPEVVKPPPSGQGREAIIGGTQDNVNNATVYLEGMENGQGYACSGTLIAVVQNTGYVLTAGHCVAGQVTTVGIGADLNSATGYSVTGQWQHPNYNTTTLDYDFGMVAFSGANSGMAIVPAAQSPDPVAASGASVELSGYGLTENGPTNHRMHVNVVTNTLQGQIDTSLKMGYDQTNGTGACNGDSGGPAYFGSGASRVVAGVTSYGDQNCQQFGVSGRVSAVYSTFILPILNGQPPMQTCDTCAQSATSPGGACESTITACQNDAACSALAQCLNNCANNDNACIQACANANQSGIAGYEAIIDCAYCSACTTLCDQSQCGAAMSTGVGQTSAASGNPSGTGSGTASVGAGGAGSQTSAGAGNPESSGGNPTTTVTKCACTMADSGDSGALAGMGAMAALGIAFSVRRRRQG